MMDSRFTQGDRTNAPLPIQGGPTFALRHRIKRAIWRLCWVLLAAWTPPSWMALRRLVLRVFGAQIHPLAMVRGSARIWWPEHLSMGAYASIGPEVICYNVAPITLGDRAIVSQRAHLCAAGHAVDHPDFPLRAKPITIGDGAWVAAEAYVGPGVDVGAGAVLGARGVAVKNLTPWTIYGGNPAQAIRPRRNAHID